MSVRLHSEEQSFGPGSAWPLPTFVVELRRRGTEPRAPFLLAIDGRSSSGKSTLARRMADVTTQRVGAELRLIAGRREAEDARFAGHGGGWY